MPGWIGFSSGGIVSTADDLTAWGQALFTPGKVLSAKDVTLMTTVGDANLGLGTWPACPCWTDAQAVKRYTAIGHHTADGGMFSFPATGVTVVAVFEPTGDDTHTRIVSLTNALTAATKETDKFLLLRVEEDDRVASSQVIIDPAVEMPELGVTIRMRIRLPSGLPLPLIQMHHHPTNNAPKSSSVTSNVRTPHPAPNNPTTARLNKFRCHGTIFLTESGDECDFTTQGESRCSRLMERGQTTRGIRGAGRSDG